MKMNTQDKQMLEYGYTCKVYVVENNVETVKKYTRYFINTLNAQSYFNELETQFKGHRYKYIKEVFKKFYKVKMLNLK